MTFGAPVPLAFATLALVLFRSCIRSRAATTTTPILAGEPVNITQGQKSNYQVVILEYRSYKLI